MPKPRLFLCNGATTNSESKDKYIVKELKTIGDEANVNIEIEDLARVFNEDINPRLIDLLEIASFVYTADASTKRGKYWTEKDPTEAWSRDLSFKIPVRDLDFWKKNRVQEQLVKSLQFLSDDKFSFKFLPFQEADYYELNQLYLKFSDKDDWPFSGVDRVIMFSGGLDSLSGTLDYLSKRKNVVLVSHRPTPVISARQKKLFDEIKKSYGDRIIHVPVWVNKSKNFSREHTQRTRSFLYSSIGTIISESVKASGVRFYENGVVSLNLPVADEVLRSRASRTTHPLVLQYLSNFFGTVLNHPFVIDNPFIFLTKTEVVQKIKENGDANLIHHSISCAHTIFQSKIQRHCGTCSQCIDRRIAIKANKLETYDNEDDYQSNVFSGDRDEGYDKNMAVNFVRHTTELKRMDENEMASKFSLELTRAARPSENIGDAMRKFIALHKRHGNICHQVIGDELGKNINNLINGNLAKNSLLALVASQKHLKSSWVDYAERIFEILNEGVPKACKTNKPDNEPHLQEICDGILSGQNDLLIREFPFLRWSSSMTKPDWSNIDHNLWIELKYVRKGRDIRRITEDIAADITKYGDLGKNVLFIIYDHLHLITDEREFKSDLNFRKNMHVRFIR